MNTTPKRYEDKPFNIEAIRFDGTNADAIAKWCGGALMEPDVHEPYTDTHRLLARAINRAGIDALANTPDYTLARKLLPELFGEFAKLFTVS